MKKPSAETQLRTVKKSLRKTNDKLQVVSQQLAERHARAIRAEQECAEWKRRFDDLLRLRPGVEAVHVPPALDERVRAMVSGPHDTNLYVNAIKLVRNETGMGLKEAKDYVDALKPSRAAA